MNYRDYIIAFDENGQPYIAHTLWQRAKSMASGRVSKGASRGAQGVGRGVRTAHKYIEKWGEGAKARYFYTQEELKAALNQGRQKASQVASTAKTAAGNAAARGRAALSTASDKARSAASSVSTKARDLSTRTSSILQKHGSETLSAIKSGASTVRDRAKELADKAGEKVSSTAAAEKVKIGAEKAAEKAKILAESAAEKAKIGAESAAEKVKIGAEKAAERVKGTAQSAVDKAKDWAGYDEKERMEAAQKEFQEKYEEGVRLTEEREPIRRAYIDFDTEMFQKYGTNYAQKMTDAERAKYDKLESDLSEISERWWDATIRQMHSAAYGSDPTLKDKLDSAIVEYQNTPLGMLDRLKRK